MLLGFPIEGARRMGLLGQRGRGGPRMEKLLLELAVVLLQLANVIHRHLIALLDVFVDRATVAAAWDFRRLLLAFGQLGGQRVALVAYPVRFLALFVELMLKMLKFLLNERFGLFDACPLGSEKTAGAGALCVQRGG